MLLHVKLLAVVAAVTLLFGMITVDRRATGLDEAALPSVPFLTVRAPLLPGAPMASFGGARGSLSAGKCRMRDVNIGRLASLLEGAPRFLRGELRQVEAVDVLGPEELLSELQLGWAEPPVLFVHGYFLDLEENCRHASLLQDNAGLGGRLVAFSWPSDGEQGSYGSDAADLEWSVPDIAEAIIELNRRSGPLGGTHVIGHGLGARGLVLALDEVAQREPEIQIGEVVLLAADVDFGVFSRLLPRISSIAEGVTVYINDSDRPLALAAQLDGYPRLGQVGNDVAGLENADFIEVTGVQAGSADRHSYHIYSEAVGRDLDSLLNDGRAASERRQLRASNSNTWTLLAE